MIKSLTPLLFLLLCSLSLMAQVPQKINYQGVARNASGMALVNQTIALRLSFHAGSPTGPVQYSETHAATTSALGLFTLDIGAGTPVSGLFTDIEWESNGVFMEVEMDPAGGTSFTAMGTSQMVSVPYALLAEDAVNALDSVMTTARLDGNGTTTSPLDLAQQGAINGNVLKWNGIAWAPANDNMGDSLWVDDLYGIHLRALRDNIGIGDFSRADVKVWIVDSTSNVKHGLAVFKPDPNDTLFAFWAQHNGKGTGIGSYHHGTEGAALYVETFDNTGTNNWPSTYMSNHSRGVTLHVRSTDQASLAPSVKIENGTQAPAIHAQHFSNAYGVAHLQSMGAANAVPTLRAEHLGQGGAGFFTTSPACNQSAVVISQGGGMGRSLEVALNNVNNTSNAVQVINEGKGMAVSVQNLNATSPQPAVSVNNVGTAGALNLTHNNAAGTAVNVISVSATNGVPAMRVQNNGTNDAGYFIINNSSNAEVAVHGESNGTGSAGFFQVSNTAYAGSALEATCNGLSTSRAANFENTGAGTAVYGSKPVGSTFGRVGHFQNFSSANTSDGVLIQTNAASGAYYALHTNNTGGGKGILISGSGDVGGNFSVSGLLSKGGGTFKIDHPLDPENKYLYHSFVESPDMMNLYNGIAVLDGNGHAIVTLPDWFESLNSDFRYQLTCIGGHADVYIASKVSGNQFEIAGGTAGLEVSWEVSGIRKDPFAMQNRVQVEVEKPAGEKGLLLHPEAYGLPKEQGLMYQLQQQHGAPDLEQK